MERNDGFFRWFRTLPIVLVLLTGLLSAAVGYLPGMVLRHFFPVNHSSAILESASRHEVDPLLVCAVIECESGWDEGAYSGAGAVGLMQVMPSTAETLTHFGYVDAWSYDHENLADASTNIEFGCACLEYLYDNLETTDQVITAYNAGLGSLQEWLGDGTLELTDVIAYPETRMYLLRVNESYKIYKRLYNPDLSPRK